MSESLGTLLKSRRESFGLSVEEVSTSIKIKAAYIRSIEAEQFDEIPGSAYIQGYLKNYADFLGIDHVQALDQFKDQIERTRQHEKLVTYFSEPKTLNLRPGFLILGISLLCTVAVYFYWEQHRYTTEEAPKSAFISEIPDPKNSRKVSITMDKSHHIPHDNSAHSQDALLNTPNSQRITSSILDTHEASTHIVMLAKAFTWIKVTSKDRSFSEERIMYPGDTYFLPERRDIVITAGNPEAIELFVEGNDDSIIEAGDGIRVGE